MQRTGHARRAMHCWGVALFRFGATSFPVNRPVGGGETLGAPTIWCVMTNAYIIARVMYRVGPPERAYTMAEDDVFGTKRPWWRAHAWVGEIAADSDKTFQFVAFSSVACFFLVVFSIAASVWKNFNTQHVRHRLGKR